MKLSTRARYALRSMIAISQLSRNGKPISLEQVAKKTKISRRYLEQLVIGLKKASLLKGVSGRSGGYLLARSAEEIKIGQIVEAAIGPINIVHCVRDPESCMKSDGCECRLLYCLINNGITRILNEYSLANLSDKKSLEMALRSGLGHLSDDETDRNTRVDCARNPLAGEEQ